MHQPIKTGIIGQGRSGWGIHAEFLRTVPDLYEIAAVADLIPERVTEAAKELGCKAYPDAESLIADPDVDLASTPDRSYNREPIEWETGSWDAPTAEANAGAGAPPPAGPTETFYRNLRGVLDGTAAPTVTLEQSRLRAAVMEGIRAVAGIA